MTAIAANTTIAGLYRMAKSRVGRYIFWAVRISKFSFSESFPVRNMATAAGTKVMDSTAAPMRAAITVNAIGWNIFPSTPVRVRIGM